MYNCYSFGVLLNRVRYSKTHIILCVICTIACVQILHSATRIAELILNFQQVGNIEFSSINFEFPCALYDTHGESEVFNERVAKDLVESLQEYIKQLEEALEEWEATIKQARSKHYELNYFTTFQLRTLRKELKKLSNDQSECRIKEEVLMLLRSISPDVADSDVLISLKEIQMASCPSDDYSIPTTTKNVNDSFDNEIDLEPKSNTYEAEPPTKGNAHDIAMHDAEASVGIINVQDLLEEQLIIFQGCTEFLGYSEELVLRAFKECGINAEKEAIEGWCFKNDQADSDDDETTSSISELQEDDSSSESESDVFNTHISHSVPGT